MSRKRPYPRVVWKHRESGSIALVWPRRNLMVVFGLRGTHLQLQAYDEGATAHDLDAAAAAARASFARGQA